MRKNDGKTLENIFHDEKQKLDDLYASINYCYRKEAESKNRIDLLNEEKEKLKNQRPKLLADEVDITQLNLRLKTIDDEIEIEEDTVKGVNDKAEALKKVAYNLKQDVNEAFRNLLEFKIDCAVEKYNKTASKMSEAMKEYIVLEYILNSDTSTYVSEFKDYNFIPNIGSDIAFIDGTLFNIYLENCENVSEKYKIPDFQYYSRK